MALIPVGQKFHTLTSSTVTSDLGSRRANSGREIYTMQDIIDTVGDDGLSKIWIVIPDGATFLSPVPTTNIIRLANETSVNESAIKIGETVDFKASPSGTANINQIRYSELQFSGVASGGFHQLVNSEFRIDVDNGGGGDIFTVSPLVSRARLRGSANKVVKTMYGAYSGAEVEDSGTTTVDFLIGDTSHVEVSNANATVGFAYGQFIDWKLTAAGATVTDARSIFIDSDASDVSTITTYTGIHHDVGPNGAATKYFINNLMNAPIKTAGGMTFSNSLPAHANDSAAAAAGLTAGQLYQTDGTAVAPLNAAGIVMIKQ